MTPMYLDHFGMAAAPFSIAPDPRYLFMSQRHREALAHLLYGVKSDDGFVVLTGEVGTGKTTICRCLLEQLPADCELALVFNPKLSVLELLATVCEEFRIPVPETDPGVKAYVDRINAWLLGVHARGRMAVLVIDEAQSLEPEVLEQIRLLTNLETNQRKLLRILLLGQPQLRELLARPDMAQLSQRIVARYHLGPLSRTDTKGYVAHRLAAAGAKGEIFSPAALDRLYRLSGGTPRLVNIIADRSLLGAYVHGRDRVDGATVLRSGREVLGERRRARGPIRAALIALGGLGSAAALVAGYLNYDAGPAAARAPQAAVVPAAATVPVGLATPEPSPPPAVPAVQAASPDPGPAAGAAPRPLAKKPAADILRPGSRGAAVERLRHDLAQALGTPAAASPNPVFDAELAEEVRRYQAAEGLPITGMVGPLTRARLAEAAKPAEDQKKEQ